MYIYKHTNICTLFRNYAYVVYFFPCPHGTRRAPLGGGGVHPTLDTTAILNFHSSLARHNTVRSLGDIQFLHDRPAISQTLKQLTYYNYYYYIRHY